MHLDDTNQENQALPKIKIESDFFSERTLFSSFYKSFLSYLILGSRHGVFYLYSLILFSNWSLMLKIGLGNVYKKKMYIINKNVLCKIYQSSIKKYYRDRFKYEGRIYNTTDALLHFLKWAHTCPRVKIW